MKLKKRKTRFLSQSAYFESEYHCEFRVPVVGTTTEIVALLKTCWNQMLLLYLSGWLLSY